MHKDSFQGNYIETITDSPALLGVTLMWPVLVMSRQKTDVCHKFVTLLSKHFWDLAPHYLGDKPRDTSETHSSYWWWGPNKLIWNIMPEGNLCICLLFKKSFPSSISVELRKRVWENTWNLTVNKSWKPRNVFHSSSRRIEVAFSSILPPSKLLILL